MTSYYASDEDYIIAVGSARVTLKDYSSNDYVRVMKPDGVDPNVYQFGAGGGHDEVDGFRNCDILKITDGTISGADYDNGYYTVSVTSGKTTGTIAIDNTYDVFRIVDVNDNLTVNAEDYELTLKGSAGRDNLYAYNNFETVNALAGNDTIQFEGSYMSVNAGAGNDTVSGYYYYSTVDGGSGNDRMFEIESNYSLINLGDGADSIEGYFNYSTINGGAGNDTIFGNGSLNVYLFGPPTA